MSLSAPIPGKHYHYRGRYCIVTEQQGSTLLYDVFLNSGQITATGFDMLSGDEQTAMEGILDRRNKRQHRARYGRSLG